MLRLVQGMLMMPAMVFLCLLVLTACTSAPVKQDEPKPKMRLPMGAVIVDTVPPVYKHEEEAIIFAFKDKCYLVMPTMVDGIFNANMSRTWCP